VTRGYGGRLAGPVRVDPRNHSAAEVGDEALLLAAAICWVARDRPSGLRAAADAGAQVILLDDGFQNPDFDKDLSLLAIDAEYGFGNGRVMPAGPLREPVEVGLARADAVVLVGSGNPIPPEIERSRLPILHAELVPIEGAWFRGRRIVAFAGIGRPAKFFATLQALGSEIVAARSFADHHRFSTAEIDGLRREAEVAGAALVTTAKDWVRIPSDERHGIEVLAVELRWRDPAALDLLLASILNHDRSPCAARGG
jgi:tetraacyldisaccharide 4'-kinase